MDKKVKKQNIGKKNTRERKASQKQHEISKKKKEKKKKTSENSECLRPLEEFFSFLGNNTIQ